MPTHGSTYERKVVLEAEACRQGFEILGADLNIVSDVIMNFAIMSRAMSSTRQFSLGLAEHEE